MYRFCTLAVLLALALPVLADDWPQWLGPKRDGSTAEKVAPWKGDLKIAWKVPVGEGHSSPVVAGGRVYLHSVAPDPDQEKNKDQGNAKGKGKGKGKGEDKGIEVVECFGVADGKPIWSKTYDRGGFQSMFGRGPRATPCVVDDKIYTYGATGVLSCLSAKTGDLVWRVETRKEFQPPALTFGVSASPIVIGNKVVVQVGAKGASIVAFDKNDGHVLWKSQDDKATYAAPIAIEWAKEPAAVFLTYNGLLGLRAEDGTVLFRYPFVDNLAESSTTPVQVGDKLLISSITKGSALVALEPAAGKVETKQEWFQKDLTCYFSTPVAMGSEIYLVTGALGFSPVSSLRCIDAKTGKELWKKGNVGSYHASLVRTGDGKLLMVEEPGKLVLIEPDPKMYRELSRSPICGKTWAHPAIADGRLFIRDDKELVCVDLGK